MTTNFFYFDQTNQKHAPVSESQLKELVAQGVIVQHTSLETDTNGINGVNNESPAYGVIVCRIAIGRHYSPHLGMGEIIGVLDSENRGQI